MMHPSNVLGANEAALAPFRLDTLQQIDAPAGCEGIWHRYVIIQGTNTITGMRCGSEHDVSRALDDMVQRLNSRFARAQAKENGESKSKAASKAASNKAAPKLPPTQP